MTSKYFTYPISKSLFLINYIDLNRNLKRNKETILSHDLDKIFEDLKHKGGLKLRDMVIGTEI